MWPIFVYLHYIEKNILFNFWFSNSFISSFINTIIITNNEHSHVFFCLESFDKIFSARASFKRTFQLTSDTNATTCPLDDGFCCIISNCTTSNCLRYQHSTFFVPFKVTYIYFNTARFTESLRGKKESPGCHYS